MFDEVNADRTGWARFSTDGKLRFRLARSIDPRVTFSGDGHYVRADEWWPKVVTFVMLNPSTADAFKLDPTVSKCVQFAQRWGAHVLQVVNLFALRSPDPKDLDRAHERGERLGDDDTADLEILNACLGSTRVIAAWGNHGWRHGRDKIVRDLLRRWDIQLKHLGLTKEDRPLHPLARGKNFIPLDREPEVWT